jgi:hypothetical protein
MFVRFRKMTARRYGDGERECVGKCQNRPRHYPRYGQGVVVRGRTFVEGCPMKPLCPLVRKRHRLEVSIVETRREGNKVKQNHVASLGSVAGNSPAAREAFWLECEARLARLANRLGPETDRLRAAVAARIPPLTDAEREAMAAQAWDRLQTTWDGHADAKAREASHLNEIAKQLRREATAAEVRALQAKTLRGNEKAYDALSALLTIRLLASALQRAVDPEAEKRLKAEVDALVGKGDT